MYNFTLHPHTISPLTLPSVQRNNVLQWVHPFLHFFKIWKIMQMIWKINKKFEIWQQKRKKTNRQTKNINNDDDKKKIHHRIHRDKGNTMIKKNMPNLNTNTSLILSSVVGAKFYLFAGFIFKFHSFPPRKTLLCTYPLFKAHNISYFLYLSPLFWSSRSFSSERHLQSTKSVMC